jgi:YD repeat-containing protein
MSLGKVLPLGRAACVIVSSILSLMPNSTQAHLREHLLQSAGVSSPISPLVILAQAAPSATVTYDGAGRTAATLYTDQTCVVHKYDAQGNRKETTVTKSDTPETSAWGSGAWGCSKWDHP